MQAQPLAVASHEATADPEEHLTFQEYLKRYDSVEGLRTEWNAGKVMKYPLSNNIRHLNVFDLLLFVLKVYLSRSNLGRVIPAAFPMYVGDDKPAREPDLMVVLTDHFDRIRENYLDGAADIAIEIVSPESVERDRGAKFVEYEAAGVPEYWLIDPQREDAVVYSLSEDGRYRRSANAQGVLTSRLLSGFTLEVSLLWRNPPPDALALLAIVEKMN